MKPDIMALKRAEYNRRPEVRLKRLIYQRAYRMRPENRTHLVEYRRRPENRTRQRIYQRVYLGKPEGMVRHKERMRIWFASRYADPHYREEYLAKQRERYRLKHPKRA